MNKAFFLFVLFTFPIMAEEPHHIRDMLKPLVSPIQPSIRPSFKQNVVLATEGKKFNNGMRSLVLKSAPDDVKRLIKILKDPACPAHLRPTRILVHGSSGCGKTTLGQIFAQEAGLECVFVPAANLGNEYQNSVIVSLEKIIAGLKGPCVLLLDQVEIILKRVKDSKEDVPTQVINILDKLAESNVIVWATTNKLEDIEKPLQNRFSGDTIKMCNPRSADLRTEIFLTHMAGIAHSLCERQITDIVSKTNKFSIREMESLIRGAYTFAYDRNSKIVDKQDLDRAIKKIEEARKALENKEGWIKCIRRKTVEYADITVKGGLTGAGGTLATAGLIKVLPEDAKSMITDTGSQLFKAVLTLFKRT